MRAAHCAGTDRGEFWVPAKPLVGPPAAQGTVIASSFKIITHRLSTMAGPEESGTGKGKGKGKSRDGGGGSAAGSAAREDITPPSRTSAGRPPTLALRLYGASGVGAAEMEAPRRRTVCLFAALVSALALARSFLLPVSFCRVKSRPLGCLGAVQHNSEC